MEITLTSAELADLPTEAKRNGAHGAPDYDIYQDDDAMCNGCGYPEHTCKCS